jgi:hypothetical protein
VRQAAGAEQGGWAAAIDSLFKFVMGVATKRGVAPQFLVKATESGGVLWQLKDFQFALPPENPQPGSRHSIKGRCGRHRF